MNLFKRPSARSVVETATSDKAIEIVVVEQIKVVFLYIHATSEDNDMSELRAHLKRRGYHLEVIA